MLSPLKSHSYNTIGTEAGDEPVPTNCTCVFTYTVIASPAFAIGRTGSPSVIVTVIVAFAVRPRLSVTRNLAVYIPTEL
jgi:hypothetical protein